MIINGTDLFMWLDDELIGSSTSYTIEINTEARETTNKGSARLRTYKPGLTDITVSCDGLVVYDGGKDLIYDAMFNYLPVKLDFGEQLAGTLALDTTTQYYTGNFIVTSLTENAKDQENATYSATFKHSSAWSRGVETTDEFYWVATDGVDGAGVDGSSDTPWKTLAYAVTRVTTPGDTINVKAGNYTMTTEVIVPVGVSIRGQGITTVFNMSYVSPSFSGGLLHGGLLLSSTNENTAGNQSISFITFDGNLTGTNAIMVRNRGSVKIHDCIIRDFLWNGVTFTNSPNVITTN